MFEEHSKMRQLRERRGLKQIALARMTGTTQGEISAIETGMREPGVYLAIKIAKALGATVEEIFGEERSGSG